MGIILIIDHDDENRSTFKKILGDRYALILTESLQSGSDVLEKTSAHTDMIFLNMGMLQTTDPAEKEEPVCGCPAFTKPIILIREDPSDKSCSDLFGKNIVENIHRPFRAAALLEMVQRHLPENRSDIQ